MHFSDARLQCALELVMINLMLSLRVKVTFLELAVRFLHIMLLRVY